MITPRISSPKAARPDFDELTAGPTTIRPFKGTLGQLKSWVAKDEQLVLAFVTPHVLQKDDCEELARVLEAPAGTHLMLFAPEVEEGFDEAYDAWTEHKLLISIHEPETIPPEVLAVPMPAPMPAVPVALSVSELDFENLHYSSHRIPDEKRRDLTAAHNPEEPAGDQWTYAYYTGNWSNLLLMRAFLDGHGIAYETGQDQHDEDFVILTDFASMSLRRRIEQDKVRERLKQEAAEKDDDLMKMFLAPSADKDRTV